VIFSEGVLGWDRVEEEMEKKNRAKTPKRKTGPEAPLGDPNLFTHERVERAVRIWQGREKERPRKRGTK